ncbi:hypothetical protein [Streptomyces siamensis]
MTRLDRAVCAMYGASFLFIAYATVQQARYGEKWAVAALAFCSLMPLVALIRETATTRTLDQSRAMVAHAEDLMGRAEQVAARATDVALEQACCERWWTSFATDHDPTCKHQQQQGRAA